MLARARRSENDATAGGGQCAHHAAAHPSRRERGLDPLAASVADGAPHCRHHAPARLLGVPPRLRAEDKPCAVPPGPDHAPRERHALRVRAVARRLALRARPRLPDAALGGQVVAQAPAQEEEVATRRGQRPPVAAAHGSELAPLCGGGAAVFRGGHRLRVQQAALRGLGARPLSRGHRRHHARHVPLLCGPQCILMHLARRQHHPI